MFTLVFHNEESAVDVFESVKELTVAGEHALRLVSPRPG
jgi:hypothetical protein